MERDLTGISGAVRILYVRKPQDLHTHMRTRMKFRMASLHPAQWQYCGKTLPDTDQKIWTDPGVLRNKSAHPSTWNSLMNTNVVWTSTDRPLWIDPYSWAGLREFANTS